MASELNERLRFVGIDDQSRAALAEALPVLEKELPAVIDQFYTNLRNWPEQMAMFKTPSSMNHASSMQLKHWLRLFSGRFDEDYMHSVRKIGLVHSRIGLDPRWYLGGYSYVLSKLFPVISQRFGGGIFGGGSARVGRVMNAMQQAALLDMELVVTVYLEENKLTFERRLTEVANDFEGRIGKMTDVLASAATELEATAETMTTSTNENNERTMAVAAAAEQASAGVQTVASATEQLSASIRMINEQVLDSARKTEQAVIDAKKTSEVVRTLAKAADTIGDVTDVISQLATKTNMLALNASVEAARAGEAGKTFEVVAGQVKELATQTGKATEGISGKIREIQETVQEAVEAIRSISGVIDAVAAISSNISSAVEQQSSATVEISRNVQQTAEAAHQVSINIVGVSQATEGTGAAAREVFASASSLTEQAEALTREVSDFIANVRQAA
jgi:methyl-accepting chemotaxis protein/hemoglobin-like flavoprotein